MKKLPSCLGHTSYTSCGYDYDCFARHEVECEYCLCNYHSLGGLYNPDTGKKVNKIIAFLLYGKRKKEE